MGRMKAAVHRVCLLRHDDRSHEIDIKKDEPWPRRSLEMKWQTTDGFLRERALYLGGSGLANHKCVRSSELGARLRNAIGAHVEEIAIGINVLIVVIPSL